MDFDDGKKDFRREQRDLSDEAAAAAEGIKDDSHKAMDEQRDREE